MNDIEPVLPLMMFPELDTHQVQLRIARHRQEPCACTPEAHPCYRCASLKTLEGEVRRRVYGMLGDRLGATR